MFNAFLQNYKIIKTKTIAKICDIMDGCVMFLKK